MPKKKFTEPTETLKAIAARVERIASAGSLDAGQAEAGKLLRVLPRPDRRHVEAAKGMKG